MIDKIERIFTSLVDVLLEDFQGGFAIQIKTTARASKDHTIDPDTGAIRGNPNVQPVDVCFPGKTPEEAWRFGAQSLPLIYVSLHGGLLSCNAAVLVRILGLIQEALMSDVITTKR